MLNPLSQVLDNPVTQSLMSNPDVIRQMLESNPQMQEVFLKMFFFFQPKDTQMTYSGCDSSFKVMERNPEIRQMLNNPEVLRQVTVLKALSVQTFSSFNTSDDGDRTEPVKVAGDDKNDGSTDAEP